jgi:IS4 transposase
MGEYADVKIKVLIKKLFPWLETKEHIEVRKGGNHNYIIKYTFAQRPFPVPSKHGVVNKHIVKDLVKKLVEWEVDTKEEIEKRLK